MNELAVVAALLAIVVAILWILLPFAVFGTKPLLERILAELTRLNEQIAKLPKT